MCGYPEDELKYKTEELMEQLHLESQLPWLYGGDFNLLLTLNEKKGGNAFNARAVDIFRKAIEACNLVDIAYTGYDFTWCNGRGGEDNIQERLDRFLATRSWIDLFQEHSGMDFQRNLQQGSCALGKARLLVPLQSKSGNSKTLMQELMQEEKSMETMERMRAVDSRMDELEQGMSCFGGKEVVKLS